MKDRDIVRWSVCAALVLAAHGLMAAALAARPDQSDLEAGSPIILMELAPLPVAAPAPPSNLAPGPQPSEAVMESRRAETQKEESEQTHDEISAPDPAAVLPPRTEQTVEPHHEQKQEIDQTSVVPVAPPSAAIPADRPAAPASGRVLKPVSAAILSWEHVLMAHLDRFKRYPSQAKNEEGVVNVAFSIDREGHLLDSRIIRSSGSSLLDNETLALLKRAAPLPRPPGDIAETQLSFVIPIRYSLAVRR